VGDQILRNWKSNRASEQLSWNVFLANISENVAWSLLSWSVGDPVIIIARGPGLLMDQIVFWQMLLSTQEAQEKGKALVWCKYALAPFMVTVFSVAAVPLCFLSQIRTDQNTAALKWIVGVLWLWSAAGWMLQIKKNKQSGILTGRDFSPKIPVLVEFYLASWLFHEYINGRTGITMYVTMGVALVINTTLLTQSLYYYTLWQRQVKNSASKSN
jgi:hypothetical protein